MDESCTLVVTKILTASSKLFGRYSSTKAALDLNHICYYSYYCLMTILTAQSSSRSLVVGWLVGWLVCRLVLDLNEKVTLRVSNGN